MPNINLNEGKPAPHVEFACLPDGGIRISHYFHTNALETEVATLTMEETIKWMRDHYKKHCFWDADKMGCPCPDTPKE
jgi:hypothetical protein